MSLIAGTIANDLKAFIIKANTLQQNDLDIAITAYANQIEKNIYEACKNITIVIPTGAISVEGSGGVSSNIEPIILSNIIK